MSTAGGEAPPAPPAPSVPASAGELRPPAPPASGPELFEAARRAAVQAATDAAGEAYIPSKGKRDDLAVAELAGAAVRDGARTAEAVAGWVDGTVHRYYAEHRKAKRAGLAGLRSCLRLYRPKRAAPRLVTSNPSPAPRPATEADRERAAAIAATLAPNYARRLAAGEA